MPFCPRCGATTQPGMAFCVACGETLPALPAAASAPGAPSEGPTTGPVGKRVHPAFATAMSLLLSAIYQPWFWWRTSREMDAYAGTRSHPIVRIGVALVVAAALLALTIGVSIAQELDLPALFEREGLERATERFAQAITDHPLMPAQAILAAAGAAVLYIGLWRLWNALRDAETRRHHPRPIDPRIAISFPTGATLTTLASSILGPTPITALLDLASLIFFIGTLVVIHQTQTRLNTLWETPTTSSATW